MPNAQDALWFKSQFQPAIEAAVAGTPFSVDMITAFACQETGEIWPALRRQGLPTARILELCVGDTIDASATGGRRAFPKNKAELLLATGGDRMFEIARQGLVDMASYIPAYRGAVAKADKFCHGFGIFQLDLQFFKSEPDYFLSRRYADFDVALARCVGELKGALKRLGWQDRTALADAEMAAVAIAYNTGRYDPAKRLKQGYFDGSKYYGENYFAYLQLAKSVSAPAAAAAPVESVRALPGTAAKKKAGGEKRAAKKPVAKSVATRKATVKKTTAENAAAKKAAAKRRSATKGAAKQGAATRAAAAREPKPARRPRSGKAAARRA